MGDKTAVMIRLNDAQLLLCDDRAKKLKVSRAAVCLIALEQYVAAPVSEPEPTLPLHGGTMAVPPVDPVSPPTAEYQAARRQMADKQCAHSYRNVTGQCVVCGHQR